MGGYQILNFHGHNFTPTQSQYIPNAYETIEGTSKAILVSGLEVAGTEYHDTFVEFKVSNSNFVGTAYGYTITIGNSGDGIDPVTITQ